MPKGTHPPIAKMRVTTTEAQSEDPTIMTTVQFEETAPTNETTLEVIQFTPSP